MAALLYALLVPPGGIPPTRACPVHWAWDVLRVILRPGDLAG